MDSLFYNLPEDFQLKFIMMNPHPVAEIMKTFYNDIVWNDCNTNQDRVYDNMHDARTIELHNIVYTNHYIFHKPWHGYYTIHEGDQVYIEKY